MKTLNLKNGCISISISEIGSALVEIETFSLKMGFNELSNYSKNITFSPSTYRISISGSGKLRVLDIRNSNCLWEESDSYVSSAVSSDGNHLVPFAANLTRVWKYSDSYVLWGIRLSKPTYVLLGELQFWVDPKKFSSTQLAPTSSSVLSYHDDLLLLQDLHNLPSVPEATAIVQRISSAGNLAVTAHLSRGTVTIIDLRMQAPSQLIDTGMKILGFAITGNVLMVMGSRRVVAWLLTEGGAGDGVLERSRSGYSDSIWTVPLSSLRDYYPRFRVDGQIGTIDWTGPARAKYLSKGHSVSCTIPLFTYDTETGNVLPDPHLHYPLLFTPGWISFLRDVTYSRFFHQSRHIRPPNIPWLILGLMKYKRGWIIDSKRRHRFWVPARWRNSWRNEDWDYDVMTLLTASSDEPVIIRF